jgi:non-specific serine/threonine protein kinase
MLQAAGDLVEHYPDGVWLVELAPLTSPELVAEKTAGVLGVRGQVDSSLENSLALFLRRKDALLLLDNAEHLIQTSAELVEHLLTYCPKLKILVTSREPLSIGGEATFQVPSLSLPAEKVTTEAELEASEAVQLFLERSRMVRPDFELTTSNAPAVAEIVRQLDGIPLALELAAARSRIMSAEQIADHLNDRFRLLVGGRRTALPKQQTLQALIDWSWNLLEEREKSLLRRLSVFSGGWSLEHAQQVASDAQLNEFAIIDSLEALVDKSLVTTGSLPGGTDRFDLLETIRQYARERLAEAGEDAVFGDRHASYFVGLVREAEAANTQMETVLSMEHLVRETDNFRAAFDWLEIHDPMLMLATAGKLMALSGQGYWSFSPPQARRWLERAIEIGRTAEIPEEERQERQIQLGLALGGLSFIGFVLGRHEEGAVAGAEAVSILRPLGESQPLAYALASQAFNLTYLGRLREAYEAGEEARKIARNLGDWVSLSIALGALAMATLMGSDFEKTHQHVAEGKALTEELGSSWIGPQILFTEGYLLANTGDLEGAEAVFREASQRFQDLGEPTGFYRSELAHALRRQGKWEQALPIYHESIQYFQDIGHEPAVANQLECFAYIATVLEKPKKAARLLGAAQAIRVRTASPINIPWEEAEYDLAMKQLAEVLGMADRDAALAEGRSMTLDEAVTLARAAGEA